MQQLKLAPQHLTLYQKMESILQNVPPKYIWQYSKIIFPVLKSTNSMVSLLSNMITYYQIQNKKGIQTTKILLELLRKAKETNDESLFKKMKELFQTDFTSIFVQLMSLTKQQKASNGSNFLNTSKLSHHNFNIQNSFAWNDKNGQLLKSRQYLEANRSNLTSNKPKIQKQLQIKNKIYSKIKDPFTEGSSAFQRSQSKISQNISPISILDRIQQQNQIVVNCIEAVKNNSCVCGKFVNQQTKKQSEIFSCQSCTKLFHLDCLKLQKFGDNCSLCQIKTINPIHQVVKTFFIGTLHKNKKNHSISFSLDQQLLYDQKIKIQIRSIRLKEKVQKQILFPDSASLIVNNQLIKQFLPLHRQSSLKFRKDEAIILQNIRSSQVNLIISQRFANKEKKDERIQLQDHLIGIFAIKQLTINQLIELIKRNGRTKFQQSKKILSNTFQLKTQSSGEQQITCDIIKIPLTCILSTQTLKIPVRGRYCTHFQCFDLQNYLLMTVNSSYSKWICPLCKKSTGQLVQDYIMKQILKLDIKNGTEVMFHKSGQFVVMSKQQQLNLNIKNISTFKQMQNISMKFVSQQRKLIEKECDETIQEIVYKGFSLKKDIQQTNKQSSTLVKIISNQLEQNREIKRSCPGISDAQDQKAKKKIKFIVPSDIQVIELD